MGIIKITRASKIEETTKEVIDKETK